MKIRLFVLGMLFAMSLAAIQARALPAGSSPAAKAAKPVSARKFDALANKALAAMKQRAAELKIGGVAVVSYAPGDSVQGWTSKMVVVGRMKDDPSATNKGSNLIGIAYAKSAEMAETLQNSGTAKRPPMTGEFGWQGGVIAHTRTGYVIVASSGGKSEDDVQVSQTGLEILKSAL